MTDGVTTVDLLRHGACEGGEIYRGTTDVPLSDEGRRQMEQAVTPADGWQRIVTSPLVRCHDFATAIAADHNLPLSIAHDLREMDFGEWEGRLVSDVWQEDKERVSGFYANPLESAPPGGESVTVVAERAVNAWNGLLAAHAGEHLLVVAHGGIIRVLLAHLLDMPLSSWARLHIPYAARARLQIHHNNGEHLPVLVAMTPLEARA